MATPEEQVGPWMPPESGPVKLAWGVYQHVAGVLAAFALAALLGHFFDIGWRGFLETLIGDCDEYVRPVVK